MDWSNTTNMSRDDNISLIIPNPDDFLPDSFSPTVKSVFIAVYSIIIASAIIGNGLLLSLVLAHKSMRTVTNILLLSLGVSDLLIAVWNMPMELKFYMDNEWTLGEPMCKMTTYIQAVAVTSSIFTLTIVAIDRFVIGIWNVRIISKI